MQNDLNLGLRIYILYLESLVTVSKKLIYIL